MQVRSDWGADESLLNIPKVSVVSNVKKVVIASFITTDPTLLYSTKEYVQGLYYYLAITYAQDLPFSYMIGWDGSIYQGSSAMGTSDTITIAYLANGDTITPAAMNAFAQLLTTIHQDTGIGLQDVSSSFLSFTNGSFAISQNDVWDKEVAGVKSALQNVIPAISAPPQFSVTIQSIDIKNINDNTSALTIHFTNSASPYLFGHVYAGNDTTSPLAVNGVWVSNIRSNVSNVGILHIHDHASITVTIDSTKPGTYPLTLYTDTAKIGGQGILVTVGSDKHVSAAVAQILTVNEKMRFYDGAGGKLLHISSIQKGNQYVVVSSQVLGSVTWSEILYDGIHQAWTSGN